MSTGEAKPQVEETRLNGLEFLEGISGMYINQKLEIIEAATGINTSNEYRVVPIGQNMPDPIPPSWMKDFTRGNLEALFKSREDSGGLQRNLCPGLRSFTMPFLDGAGTRFFSAIRPFRCSLGLPYVCIFQPQELVLLDARDETYAKVKETKPTCCGRTFEATDENDRIIYDVSYNCLNSDSGRSNFCAPSCFNSTLNVDIREPKTGKHLGVMTSLWPGFSCASLTDRSHFVVRFAPNSHPKQRAALVAAMILIEFAVFEQIRAKQALCYC